MNLFVYDDYLKKYTKKVNNIEIALHNLNLNGKIIYLGAIKKIDEFIREEISHGVKTVIAVGNNKTISTVLTSLITSDSEVVLGIIPVGDNNSIAQACGIKDEKSATDILLARRLEQINVAYANKNLFLSNAKIRAKNTSFKIKEFTIDPIEKGDVNIINLLTPDCSTGNIKSDPRDNLLDLTIYNRRQKPSFFQVNELRIENSAEEPLILDNSIPVKTPAKIGILDKKINIIVSKDRIF